MTNQEAGKVIKDGLEDMSLDFADEEQYEALTMAIKALEQQPILDKIKTEIEQVKAIMNEEIIEHDRKDLINFINGINQCLMIIDKYRQEG